MLLRNLGAGTVVNSGIADEMDESEKSAAVVGALLVGHQSSHQRADQLTAASGVKRQRPRAGREAIGREQPALDQRRASRPRCRLPATRGFQGSSADPDAFFRDQQARRATPSLRGMRD
jgi:hypothetical protein